MMKRKSKYKTLVLESWEMVKSWHWECIEVHLGIAG
jgi:hypothetical protein